MKAILSERNLVLVLFVMVFIIFSLAHEDSKKMGKGILGLMHIQPEISLYNNKCQTHLPIQIQKIKSLLVRMNRILFAGILLLITQKIMYKLFLVVFLFAAINCISQTPSKSLERSTRQQLIKNDSVLTRLKQFDDSIAEDTRKKEELKEIEQSTQRSVNYFAQMQKERRAKEKQNAIIRIGIGIFFFIVLIFGLRRRMKK